MSSKEPDTTEILGDVQVQIRDYVSELEEQQQSGEAGAQPVEDIFADTTAEETGLEAESTITEEIFSEYCFAYTRLIINRLINHLLTQIMAVSNFRVLLVYE